uniref:Uncharacterized protein n=1 Tax=Glossina pallidipes TaxID=7398 RepID=A0A1B0ADS8_GLOPL
MKTKIPQTNTKKGIILFSTSSDNLNEDSNRSSLDQVERKRLSFLSKQAVFVYHQPQLYAPTTMLQILQARVLKLIRLKFIQSVENWLQLNSDVTKDSNRLLTKYEDINKEKQETRDEHLRYYYAALEKPIICVNDNGKLNNP